MSSFHDPVALWTRLICNPGHKRTHRELDLMSSDERAKVFADIGGAQEINKEDPNFILKCMQEMERTLGEMRNDVPSHLKKVMSSDYTQSEAFRLMFLRADNFDVNQSCHRMIRHFETKAELFGTDKVERTITLDDLNDDDMATLESGGIQILPRPDQFGRQIIVSRQLDWKYRHRENLLRTTWYILMSMLEDENVQRRGIVGMGYGIGDAGSRKDYELIRRIINLPNAIPMRICAIYTCFNSQKFGDNVVDVAVHMFNAFLRARFRIFHGTRQECDYQLMLMGINPTDIPIDPDGRLAAYNHLQWLQKRKDLDAKTRRK